MEIVTESRVITCKYCGSTAVVKFGTYKNIQRYWCKTCRRKFADNQAMPNRRVPPEQVGAAISMFFKGLSYEDVRQEMKNVYGFSPSKSTLYKWVTQYSKQAVNIADNQKVDGGELWAVDEMFVKTDEGKTLYVFDVMSENNRYLLASYASEYRTTKAAEIALNQALSRAKHSPKFVVSDHLRSYEDATERVFGSETKHIQADGLTAEVHNNVVERLHGTIREREKVLRALKNQETAQVFLDGWRLNYNYFKPHFSLNDKTPAEVAGVERPFTDWKQVAGMRPSKVFIKARKQKVGNSVRPVFGPSPKQILKRLG